MKAVWHDRVIAESGETIWYERRHYFPPTTVRLDLLRESRIRSLGREPGVKTFFHIVLDDATIPNAAWAHTECSAHLRALRGYVAFWRGIVIVP